MTPHKYELRCRSCEMQPTDVAFLSAHPDEPLQTVYNAVQSLGMAGLVGSEEQTVKHAPGPLYTTVPEILAHMRDVLSHMDNGDYLIARIDEVLAARAIELENIAGENRRLRETLKKSDSPRCLICGQQYALSGCTPESCSYRPRSGDAEWIRIENQKRVMQALHPEVTRTDMADSQQSPPEGPPAQPLCPACGKEGMIGATCPHCGRIFYTPDRDTVACYRCYGSGMVNEVQCRACNGIGQVNCVRSTGSESQTPTEQHIHTPDELLELLASISSDPQVEGLSLAQKASTMALLHIAKGVQQIAFQVGDLDTLQQIAFQLEDLDTALEEIGVRISDSPVNPGAAPESGSPVRTLEEWKAWAKEHPELARTFSQILLAASTRTEILPTAVQSPDSPQKPS